MSRKWLIRLHGRSGVSRATRQPRNHPELVSAGDPGPVQTAPGSHKVEKIRPDVPIGPHRTGPVFHRVGGWAAHWPHGPRRPLSSRLEDAANPSGKLLNVTRGGAADGGADEETAAYVTAFVAPKVTLDINGPCRHAGRP